jgi:hypothetical protein
MSHTRNRAFLLAGLLTSVCLPVSAQTPPTQPRRDSPRTAASATGSIKGQVVDAVSGRGLPRATLYLAGGQLTVGATTMTNDDGAFAFEGVTPGRYTVTAAKITYETGYAPNAPRGRRPQRLEVTAGAAVENVTIALHRASAITGRVVDEFGDPVQNVRVALRRFPGAAGGRPRQTPGMSEVRTNDIGEFRLAPVPAGRYLLTAETQLNAFTLPNIPAAPAGFVAWPQAPSLDQAQPLVVERGHEFRDVELQLFPTKSTRVTGVVLGVDGQPATGASINVGPVFAGDDEPYSGYGTSTQNGRFELTLPPGVYDLSASLDEGVRDRLRTGLISETTRITVSGEPMDGLTLQINAPRSIAGRIVFAGGGMGVPPPDPAKTNVFIVGRNMWPQEPLVIKPDFSFATTIAGDVRHVQANAAGWFLRSIVAGDEDVTVGGIRFGDRKAITDLVITFTDRPTKLSAAVADTKGQPATEFLVVVFPVEKRRRPTRRYMGSEFAVQREAGPSPEGGPARLPGLLPGEYFAIAIHPDDYDAAGLPGDYTVLEPLAQRFTLGEGEVRVLNLTLANLPSP